MLKCFLTNIQIGILKTDFSKKPLFLSGTSYAPDLMAEYATNAAIVVTTSFALDLLAFYYDPYIKTGKDQRKAMFRDFQGAYQEARDECQSRTKGHEFLIKELSSAHRGMQKAMREL
ncbi:MAG: hypothetical protein ACP5EO_13665 [Acidithiobacillus sp.]